MDYVSHSWYTYAPHPPVNKVVGLTCSLTPHLRYSLCAILALSMTLMASGECSQTPNQQSSLTFHEMWEGGSRKGVMGRKTISAEIERAATSWPLIPFLCHMVAALWSLISNTSAIYCYCKCTFRCDTVDCHKVNIRNINLSWSPIFCTGLSSHGCAHYCM